MGDPVAQKNPRLSEWFSGWCAVGVSWRVRERRDVDGAHEAPRTAHKPAHRCRHVR
jgi:hypothetical protein